MQNQLTEKCPAWRICFLCCGWGWNKRGNDIGSPLLLNGVLICKELIRCVVSIRKRRSWLGCRWKDHISFHLSWSLQTNERQKGLNMNRERCFRFRIPSIRVFHCSKGALWTDDDDSKVYELNPPPFQCLLLMQDEVCSASASLHQLWISDFIDLKEFNKTLELPLYSLWLLN